jgi:2-iminobutanoate/2-iminopropanoate deaminase
MSKPVGPYSPVLAAGGWVITSGQLGLLDGVLVEGGVPAQTKQIFANAKGLLDSGGASLKDVVKCTVFLADMADFAAMNAAYVDGFGDHAPRPTRSTVGNVTMALGALVEIEFWAFIGNGGVAQP